MRRAPEKVTHPEMFLFAVLRHVFIDSVRKNRRINRLIDLTFQADLETVVLDEPGVHVTEDWNESREQLQLVTAAVQAMPRHQQRLFVLRFVDELPYAAIAQHLGISEPLARKRVQLLRARLMVALESNRFRRPSTTAPDQKARHPTRFSRHPPLHTRSVKPVYPQVRTTPLRSTT